MTPDEALAELLDLSTQVRDAAILGESGFVLASSGTAERGEQLARVAADLAAAAADVRPATEVTRVEVTGADVNLFPVKDAGRTAIATTGPEPVAGLIVYDLRTMLGRLDAPAARRPSRKKKKDATDA